LKAHYPAFVFRAMSGQNGSETEEENDGQDLLQGSVADFDSNSVAGKMDSNDMFGHTRNDFLFSGSRNGQDNFLREFGGGYNNSISEGDFGSFDYDNVVGNKGSLSESGEFVLNNVLSLSEQPDQDFPNIAIQRSNESLVPEPLIQSTLAEPIRPPSADHYHDISYNFSGTGQTNEEERPFAGEHDALQHSFQPHQLFQHREEPMGAFEQRQIADVSVEDVRQRQLQFASQSFPSPLHHLQNQEEIPNFSQHAMGQQQGDDFNQMSNQQFVYNGAQPSQHDIDFHQQLSSIPHLAQPRHVGLSNTVHANSYQRRDGPLASLHMRNSLTALHGYASNVPDAMYAAHMVPSNPSIQSLQGNVSIVAERQSPKALFNGFDDTGSSASLGHGKTVADAMAEAMEKLSDSMRRTAMSRSMVKQFSGRSLLGKQGSVSLLAKQRSMRGLSSQLSDRNLMGEHGSSTHNSRGMRRSSSTVKHQLHHPARTRSNRNLDSLNQSSHSITLNIDGRNMGEL
jgi:hypothetical protein